MTEPPLKTALRLHLAEYGLRTDLTVREVNARLRGLLGRRRYAAYRAATERYDAGLAGIEEVYLAVRTLAEANLLMSLQGTVTVEANWHIADQCLKHVPRGGRVCELGCWAGSFSSFLATHRPDLQVIGVDQLDVLLFAASRDCQLPNLSFANWDYASGSAPQLGRFDALVSSFGLDFDQKVERDYWSGATSCRGSQGYAVCHREAWPYFSNWRQVAQPGAVLFAVLRVGCLGHAVAVVDAATDAGWSFDPHRSKRFGAGDKTLPLLAFVATATGRLDAEKLSGWWAGSCRGMWEGSTS